MDNIPIQHAGGSITPGGIARSWIVRMPLGHDSAGQVRKAHHKSLRGLKRDAQAYLDWYAGMVAAGNAPLDTISQSELQQLDALERKAAEFRGKLLARVEAGALPGELSLSQNKTAVI